MTAHALLSASAASRWLACPGSVALSQGRPDTSSVYADEGTAAHEVAAACLLSRDDADLKLGLSQEINGRTYTVDEDMAANVQVYLDHVRGLVADGELLVEQRVDYSAAIGVPESFGTSDTVILSADLQTLTIVDLKYGRGVKVSAEQNTQLQLYALGALEQFGPVADIRRVQLHIVQPRLDHISEWEVSVEELEEFRQRAARQAAVAMDDMRRATADTPVDPAHLRLSPGEEQCRFCKAKAICPALAKEVATVVTPAGISEFDDLEVVGPAAPQNSDAEWLARALSTVGLVEDWCAAVRAEAFSRLQAGQDVPGYKLVEGKRGARRWADDTVATEMLKSFRLKVDEMFNLKLISPTQAEKLVKAGVIGPRQWPKLQEIVTQPPGSPSVAPVHDKRPAIPTGAAMFDDLTTAAPAEARSGFAWSR